MPRGCPPFLGHRGRADYRGRLGGRPSDVQREEFAARRAHRLGTPYPQEVSLLKDLRPDEFNHSIKRDAGGNPRPTCLLAGRGGGI